MRGPRLRLWVAGLLADAVLGMASEASPASPPVPGPADLELIEEILEDTRVDTSARRASLSGYLLHLWRSFQEAVADLLAWASNFVSNWGAVLPWTGRILVVAAAAAVALGLGIFLWRALGRRTPAKDSAIADAPADRAPEELGRENWREEIERRLARGALPEALEATWWWLARSLAGNRAEASWTSRELVRRARRPDVSPLLRRLDAMTYGSASPSADGVRRLVEEAEAAL